MTDENVLAGQFEANRARLRAVAYRMLGSLNEADDAVQEAWLRLSRSDPAIIANMGGWLTTVVARICLDMLRARKFRREDPMGPHVPEPVAVHASTAAEEEAELADAVGLALLVVLEKLAPAERLAFVLHDMFAVPFEEIAPIVGRSTAAARQLASRARRRVQGGAQPRAEIDADLAANRKIVEAFLAASKGGDFQALLAVLDPDVTFRADAAAIRLGETAELRGADAVAKLFMGRARLARPALVNGAVGIVVAPQRRLRVALAVTIAGGRIAGLDVTADPERLRQLELAVLEG